MVDYIKLYIMNFFAALVAGSHVIKCKVLNSISESLNVPCFEILSSIASASYIQLNNINGEKLLQYNIYLNKAYCNVGWCKPQMCR